MHENIVIKIVMHTPVFVWLILILLIKKGITTSQEKEVNVPNAIIMPVLFCVWGLEKIIGKFSYVGFDLVAYILSAILGGVCGYIINHKRQKYFYVQGHFYQKKCYFPLIIILLNFTIKYSLNVALAMNPLYFSNFYFNTFYSVMCGLFVGIFWGRILNLLVEKKKEINF